MDTPRMLTVNADARERLRLRHGGARPQVRLTVQEHIPRYADLVLCSKGRHCMVAQKYCGLVET